MSYKDGSQYRYAMKIIMDNWTEPEYDVLKLLEKKLQVDEHRAQTIFNNIMDNLISNEKIR
jgi:hypothetical protein